MNFDAFFNPPDPCWKITQNASSSKECSSRTTSFFWKMSLSVVFFSMGRESWKMHQSLWKRCSEKIICLISPVFFNWNSMRALDNPRIHFQTHENLKKRTNETSEISSSEGTPNSVASRCRWGPSGRSPTSSTSSEDGFSATQTPPLVGVEMIRARCGFLGVRNSEGWFAGRRFWYRLWRSRFRTCENYQINALMVH